MRVILLVKHHGSSSWGLVVASEIHMMNIVGTAQLAEVHVSVLNERAIWSVRRIFVRLIIL